MKTIPLSQGKAALVDDADYAAVSQFKWHAHKSGRRIYAARNILRPDGKKRIQYLHQFLMPGVAEIDHINGNALDNQRFNLRSVTHKQNLHGFQRKRLDATSQFRGVGWDRKTLKWKAEITINGKNKPLGYFDSEEDAARARDRATLKYYGPDAYFNFP